MFSAPFIAYLHECIWNCDITVNRDATPIVGRAIMQWDETYLSHWMKPTCIHIVWIRSQLTFSIAKPKNILGHLLNIIFYPLQSRNGHLTKVSVTICPKGIQVIRLSDRTILLDVPMDRWAYQVCLSVNFIHSPFIQLIMLGWLLPNNQLLINHRHKLEAKISILGVSNDSALRLSFVLEKLQNCKIKTMENEPGPDQTANGA